MTNTQTIECKVVELINGLGILKTIERAVDHTGKAYGQKTVWYDVCMDKGDGDMLESFKTLREAKSFAKAW